MIENKSKRLPIGNIHVVLLCLTFLVVACDPAQMLRIENKTGLDARITLVFKKGSEHYMFDESDPSDTLQIELDTTAENSTRDFHFGIGHWKIQSSMDGLVSMIESIEIETSKSSERFSGEDQIRDFLTTRITGRYKEMIHIRVE